MSNLSNQPEEIFLTSYFEDFLLYCKSFHDHLDALLQKIQQNRRLLQDVKRPERRK